jgi:uncharacterized protein YraI
VHDSDGEPANPDVESKGRREEHVMRETYTSMISAAVLTAGLALAGDARAQGAVEVTASALNVRSGPGTGNGVLGSAGNGQVYPVLQRSGDWTNIQFGSTRGWAHSNYLRTSSASVLTVTAGTLNVRSGAGTGYRQIGTLSQGTKVAVRSSSGDWKRIDFNGQAAYVHGAYLSANGGGSTGGGSTGGGSTGGGSTGTRPTSARGFIQFAASGPGYYCYGTSARRWGTTTMVYGVERIARRWASEQPGAPRMGLGDTSAMNGGPISGHASHQKGVDIDVRPMRTSGEAPVTRFDGAYSRTRTQALVRLFRAELPITHIFFNDANVSGVSNWPNHDNHFHARTSR